MSDDNGLSMRIARRICRLVDDCDECESADEAADYGRMTPEARRRIQSKLKANNPDLVRFLAEAEEVSRGKQSWDDFRNGFVAGIVREEMATFR